MIDETTEGKRLSSGTGRIIDVSRYNYIGLYSTSGYSNVLLKVELYN